VAAGRSEGWKGQSPGTEAKAGTTDKAKRDCAGRARVHARDAHRAQQAKGEEESWACAGTPEN
jgi:hypothetical protein